MIARVLRARGRTLMPEPSVARIWPNRCKVRGASVGTGASCFFWRALTEAGTWHLEQLREASCELQPMRELVVG